MTSTTLHASTPEWLERIRFVLVRTSHPGNVGATARAMQVMGLRELVLVAPREPDIARHPEAVARASGAVAVLEQARCVATLDEALAPCGLTIAVSAQMREFGPLPQPPEEIAALAFARARAVAHERIGFVFGCERDGLSIDEAGRCQRMCTIPADTGYSSLNLAQAVQIVAYCLRAQERRQAAGEDPVPDRPVPADHAGAVATHAQIEALFTHLRRALVRIGFLDPRHPKKLMPRLRRLLARAQLQPEEVALLRGMCTQIEKACRYPYGPAESGPAESDSAESGPAKSGSVR